MLKELTRPRDVELPPVWISKDDIEGLIQVIKRDAPELEPRLATERYGLDSLKDLDDPRLRENPPKELHIEMVPPRSSTPMITVDVRSSSVILHAEADDALSRGILIKAGEYLRSKQRRASSYGLRLIDAAALMLIAGLLLIVLAKAPIATGPPPSGPTVLSPDVMPIGGVLAVVGFAMLFWIGQIRSKIVTTTRVEAKRFVNWNMDRVIQLVSLAIAIATLVEGVLAFYFGR